jgi:hypothetical protein
MIKIIVETGGAPVKFELGGSAVQFKQLWEKIEETANAQGRRPLGIAAAITDRIITGNPNEDLCEEWGQNAWVIYAVLRTVSEHSDFAEENIFELAAHQTITATIRRGSHDKTFAMKIASYPALDS